MTVLVDVPEAAARELAPESAPISELTLDTTRFSFVHQIARYTSGRPFTLIKAGLLGIAITYVPLVVAAVLSGGPLFTSAGATRLPFFRDWNIAFAFLVSFPTLLILTIADDSVLAVALKRIQTDGILTLPSTVVTELREKWERSFGFMNRAAYIAGILIGAVVVRWNYLAYMAGSDVGHWTAPGGHASAAGYVFLYCIFVFYAFVPVYIFRSVASTLFLKNLVAKAPPLRMLPFHPDKCGGLKPVGRLGLRNQYVLTIFGINVVLLVAVSLLYLHPPRSLYGLMTAAAVAYLILGPIVFMGPLVAFRSAMVKTKTDLMGEVAGRLRIELLRLRSHLASGPVTKDDEELIDRLRKIGAVIDELPVWPFDAHTLRKFLTAYVAPLLTAVLYTVAKSALPVLLPWLGKVD